MSGGPPHHPHNRLPAGNTAWNHLQVPNFFPRQPQLAHMSSEHPLIHQPTWHTPTTEPLKAAQHPQMINLEQMLSERQFLRASPGVDLSLSRAPLNGDVPAAPISLSVRDTNKINSLAASALERQEELTKAASPKPASPAAKAKSPTPDKQLSPKSKRVKRVDSILERLNPQPPADGDATTTSASTPTPAATSAPPAAAVSSHDENSNSSSILNVPTPREEDVVSPYSNEDSLDSNKSRRKRKPAKTMKVTKEAEVPPAERTDAPDSANWNPSALPKPLANSAPPPTSPRTTNIAPDVEMVDKTAEPAAPPPERRKSASKTPRHDSQSSQDPPRKTRRRTSFDDETIDNIAAMVGNLIRKDDPDVPDATPEVEGKATPAAPATSDTAASLTAMVTLAQKKDFVAVEDKLEEMFAGLEEPKSQAPLDDGSTMGSGSLRELLAMSSTNPDKVSSTSNLDVAKKKPQRKRKQAKKKIGETPKKKQRGLKTTKKDLSDKKKASKKLNGKAKFEASKDVYAYDSGSNASSSKSRGPFVHISGPRDSPISVSVVNTPANDNDDGDSRKPRAKKLHDDGDPRHKVRAKGLHCSTLSNKYDTHTRDSSWICAFCKRGPYSGEFAANDDNYSPGDLFGPYVITTACEEYTRRLTDPFDKSFRSKKVARCLTAAVPGKPTKRGPRRKSSQQADAAHEPAHDYDLGIAHLEDGTYEVWAHEDCMVWAPGIFLVGPKLVGLEAAVWTASNIACARCPLKGANVCCIKRGCTKVMHLGCAYLARWKMSDENYTSFCEEHA